MNNIQFKAENKKLTIVDTIDTVYCQIIASRPISIEKTTNHQIPNPVDSAIQITTNSLTFPEESGIHISSSDDKSIFNMSAGQELELSKGSHVIDVAAPMKVYCKFDDSANITSNSNKFRVDFEELTRVFIGVRSRHTQPADVIRTTSDSRDIMQAVSHFGSGLKTLSPERSFPTLRGHPPGIRIANELVVPDDIKKPDSGIRIQIPPDLRHIFVVASLAYYLGADIVPGSEFQLKTNNFTFKPNTDDTFEETVAQILKHVFFLDCIVRTEGEWPGPLYERQLTEDVLKFDIKSIYDNTIENQIKQHLQIPVDTLDPYIPEWPLETHLQVTPGNTELLPFITNDLSVIQTRNKKSPGSSMYNHKINELNEKPVIIQNLNGLGSKKIKSVVSKSALTNSVDRSPRAGPIEINVICNDIGMKQEFVNMYGTYGDRTELPCNVKFNYDLTKSEFRNILTRDSDFVHYIGHIDSTGFRCSDGRVDAATVESVNVDTFFLNACQSYQQGFQLVEGGSLGGIVTTDDIQNKDAVSIGNTIAHALNRGYPLYAAIDLAREQSTTGNHYHIVGNAKTILAQTDAGLPMVRVLSETDNGLRFGEHVYSEPNSSIGATYTRDFTQDEYHYLVPCTAKPLPISRRELLRAFELGRTAFVLDGELYWSDEVKTEDIV